MWRRWLGWKIQLDEIHVRRYWRNRSKHLLPQHKAFIFMCLSPDLHGFSNWRMEVLIAKSPNASVMQTPAQPGLSSNTMTDWIKQAHKAGHRPKFCALECFQKWWELPPDI
jgi:hypothetical protein